MSTIPRVATARVALVGDRSAHVRAHVRVPLLLDALRARDLVDLDAYWIPTATVTDGSALDGFDGVWLLPGSPYRSETGAVTAIRAAREGGVPFLGTCGGFQHALLEYARDVCGLLDASHEENTPGVGDPVIAPFACSLVGHEGVVEIVPGSLVGRALGATRTVERYHCSYGLNPVHLDVLREHGMRFTGFDDTGEVRVAELADHPFFLCTLFQPELADDDRQPHPVVRAFAAAVTAHAESRERSSA